MQGLPKKFDQKKILKVIKKKFACNGTIVTDAEMGEVVQLQGDQRKDVQDFLTDKKEGLGLDAKTIKVRFMLLDVILVLFKQRMQNSHGNTGPRFLVPLGTARLARPRYRGLTSSAARIQRARLFL